MKQKRWTIYCHIHIDSGRRYIGLTSKTMMARWNGHVNLAKRSNGKRSHFAAAIRLYGKDKFSHEVLAMSWDLEGANTIEELLIEQYQSRDPEKGFNLMKGGAHIPHPIRKNPWNDSEYRARGCAAAKARWQDPVIRAKNIAATKAAISTPESKARRSVISRESNSRPEVKEKLRLIRTGKKHTEESLAKMSKIHQESPSRREWTEEDKETASAIQKELWSRPEMREQKSLTSKSLWTPEFREKMSKASREAMTRPDVKEKISKAVRESIRRKSMNDHSL